MTKDRLRVAGAIWVAFVVVGAVISYLQFDATRQRSLHDLRLNLITVARLAAQSVDGDAHETLVKAEQQDSKAYKDQTLRLERALAAAPNLRFIYTMRRIDGRFYFVLDPTPAGDADGDGVEDKSYLMDEYGDETKAMDGVFDTGVAQAESEVSADRWGHFLSAYAPIFNSRGNQVAILGVDMAADDLVASVERSKGLMALCFAVSILIGAIFAAILSRLVVRPVAKAVRLSQAASVRFVALQFILAGLVAGAIAAAIYGQQISSEDERTMTQLAQQERHLRNARQIVVSMSISNRTNEIQLDALRQRLRDAGLNANEHIDRMSVPAPENDVWKGELASIFGLIESRFDELYEGREVQALEMSDRRDRYLLTLSIAALLSLSSLFLVRLVATQQTRLTRTIDEGNRLRESYQQVVENLPIGLFQFKSGECQLTNWSFDLQTRRLQAESPTDAFRRSLHPDDRGRVFEILEDHQNREEAITFNFRLVGENDVVDYFESRGVPVFTHDGEIDHLLCFNVNITDITLANQSLVRKNQEVGAANERLTRALEDLEDNFDAMVAAWVKAVDAKDPYTAGHSERVTSYAVRIGERAGLSATDIRILEKGTMIHDIGKIGVPDDVLTKPDRLTDEEFELIRRHVVIGAEMIQNIPQFRDCLPIVRWHHERLDGGGYPDGLRGDAIPELVRICAVADCFDAMTSTRAYRTGMPVSAAIEELKKDAENDRLDQKFVAILADIIREEGLIEHRDVPDLAA